MLSVIPIMMSIAFISSVVNCPGIESRMSLLVAALKESAVAIPSWHNNEDVNEKFSNIFIHTTPPPSAAAAVSRRLTIAVAGL